MFRTFRTIRSARLLWLIMSLILMSALCAPALLSVSAEPLPYPVYVPMVNRAATWLDQIIFSKVSDPATAISQLQAGTINLYPEMIGDSNLFNQIKTSPGLSYKSQYGVFDNLMLNFAQCTNTNVLNPFSDMKIREAMNWAIDRNYVVASLLGGMGAPKYTVLNTAFPDYTRYSSIIGPLEASYGYDFNHAKSVVDSEMPLLGAVKGEDGKWEYNQQDVTIIGIIRNEDARLLIGRYFADQLELLGFTVSRQEMSRPQAAPIWQGDTSQCLFNFYTGGWIDSFSRDQGASFIFYNEGVGSGIPLMTGSPSSTLKAADLALYNNAFTTLNERAALFATALTLSMQESWWGVMVADTTTFEPYQSSLAVSSDAGSGIGSQMWPYTLHFKNQPGGILKIGESGLLIGPWNPIAGSNWVDDATVMLATEDNGLLPDPNTGLNVPKLVQSASVVAKTGLPVFSSSPWLTLTRQTSIAVPPDAWADWDASSQTFITASQRAANDPNYKLTANLETTVTYVPNLWQTKWHDGSNLSIGDFIVGMIMKFDPGKTASAIYDPDFANYNLAPFMSYFKGVKIVSTNPLTITTWTNRYLMDAENSLMTWYPSYSSVYDASAYRYGTGAWHNLALAIKGEADGTMAFSYGKSSSLGVYQTSFISGASLPVMTNYLNSPSFTNTLPYAPTLGQYITPSERDVRYNNLKNYSLARGHLWIGTGPYYITQVNSGAPTITLAPFASYLFPPNQFWSYIKP